MLRIEKINGKNVWDIVKLSVEEQANFVAENKTSIIEAYTTITGGGQAYPFGIYDDDLPVGFLSASRLWEGSNKACTGLHSDKTLRGRGILLAVLRAGKRNCEGTLSFFWIRGDRGHGRGRNYCSSQAFFFISRTWTES